MNNVVIYIIISISVTTIWSQPCQNSSNCQNGGMFSEKNCNCSCYPSYYGSQCEKISCELSDPSSCGTFSKQLCSITIISNYCPRLCEKPCSLKCLNGGKIRNNKCECMSQFEGTQCENIKCEKEDQRCYVKNFFFFKFIKKHTRQIFFHFH